MKKTKAMLIAEAPTATIASFESLKDEYRLRLMRVMASYSQINRYGFENNGSSDKLSFYFSVMDSDGDVISHLVLPAEMLTFDNLYDLERAERMVELYYEEERELLGIK